MAVDIAVMVEVGPVMIFVVVLMTDRGVEVSLPLSEMHGVALVSTHHQSKHRRLLP